MDLQSTPQPAGGLPTSAEVADVVAATHLVKKRKRAGTHLVQPAPSPATAPAPAFITAVESAPVAASGPALSSKRVPRPKTMSDGAKALKVKKSVRRTPKPVTPSPPPAESPDAIPNSCEPLPESSTAHGEFMDLLNDSVHDGPPLAPYGVDDMEKLVDVNEQDEETDEDGMEEVTEVETGEVTKKKRAVNYTEIEDTTLCRAWAQVGMDAAHGTDQTGKRYWQRIEDRFCQLLPRVKNPVSRSFRSLQGRWEVIKPACSRWSAAMDAVIQNPISGSTVDEYEGFAHDRYKEMKGSNGKRFAFKHCHDVLKHLPKWQLRDQEKEIKKGAMKMLDDSDEDGPPKWDKPEGTKKAKERLKMAAEQTALNDKFDQMMKTKETVTMKTLEAKLTIYEKKKEIKLAMIEAARVEAARKADLEEKKLNIKREKAMKELLAEEKDIMMMNTSVMNETQLLWWNNTTADITARRSLLHQSGTGGASVEHEQNPAA